MSKKKQVNKTVKQSKPIDFYFNPDFLLPIDKFLFLIPFLWGIILSVIYLYKAFNANGFFGFPLDDPWIHLTFAKNLVEYGSFSYFKNELATSGSTSPIYTLLASALYIFTHNEFILSFIIGIFFFSFTILFTYKTSHSIFTKEPLIALLPALLVAANPKMAIISVSGMETTLFTFILLITLYNYFNKNYLLTGILSGLIIWTRPDGVVFIIALFLDILIKQIIKVEKLTFKDTLRFLIPFISLIFAYFLFNYFLSGSFLPNTFAAKIKFYANNDSASFLKNDVFKEFSDGNYLLLFIPFVIGIIFIVKDLIKKTYNPTLIMYLFIGGLIAVYYIKLPFSHRFGRYLIPIIPFYAIIAIYSIRRIIYFIGQFEKTVLIKILSYSSIVISIIISILFLVDNFKSSGGNLSFVNQYTQLCNYHNERHKAVGEWLAKNTPENAVIATHDIGAIAYYSNRKIVDMVGLVSPEVINHIGTIDFNSYLNEFLNKSGINYLVVLKNWFEVVNDRPLFVPVNEPEIIEVYQYKKDRTHIAASPSTQINVQVGQLIRNKMFSEAESLLNKSLSYDNKSARTFMLFAILYQMTGRIDLEEINWKKAIELFPDYYEAKVELAKLYLKKNNTPLAKELIAGALSNKSDYAPALNLLNSINSGVKN